MGSRFLATNGLPEANPGAWSMVPGFWFWSCCSMVPVPGPWYLAPGRWSLSLVHGPCHWSLVLDPQSLVTGRLSLLPGPGFPGPWGPWRCPRNAGVSSGALPPLAQKGCPRGRKAPFSLQRQAKGFCCVRLHLRTSCPSQGVAIELPWRCQGAAVVLKTLYWSISR